MIEFYNMMLTPIMSIEILVAEFLFCINQKKEDYYWIRVIGLIIAFVGVIVWIELFYVMLFGGTFTYGGTGETSESLFKLIYYFTVFLLTVLVIRGSYKGSWWTILYYSSCGYAMQHLGIGLSSLFSLFPFINESIDNFYWLESIYEICILGLLYVSVYFLLIRYQSGDLEGKKNIPRKVTISLIVIFICIVLSRLTRDNPNRKSVSIIAESIYSIVCCGFILYDLIDLSEKEKIQGEVELMQEILHREREQYKLSKENITLINVKCHDLKHQLNLLKNNSNDKSIEDVKQAVMIYDSVVKTGNDVLDVILTEKSLYCQKNHIILTCMADGKSLSFMDNSDIYSLFGNALSNSIEAVMAIKDTDKRAISLNVSTFNNILSIHIENFFYQRPQFENGVPITSKDKDYHGFGIKSMGMIAKKYQGAMKASVRNEKFNLDFVIKISGN